MPLLIRQEIQATDLGRKKDHHAKILGTLRLESWKLSRIEDRTLKI